MAELLFITTILLIGLIIGWVTLRNTLNSELEDFSHAIGDLNQSYAYSGVLNDNGSAQVAGSAFSDAPDANADDGGTWVFVPASGNETGAP